MDDLTQPPPGPVRRKPTPHFTWEDVATAGLPVVACFLGGSTEKWAEGVVVCLLGLMLLFNPPRFSLGWAFHGILLALLACAAVAFLPADWFYQPAWRQALVNDFGMQIGSTVSPQPWVTSGCLLSFIAGLCWVYYVCGQEVEIRAVRRQLRLFAMGVILLAGLAVAFYLMKSALPFWHNQRGFGFFPNRNQTANLLGLTSIVVVACGHDEIRRGKKWWIFWVAGLAILITALVLNFSRAGIALLLVGSVLWLVVLVLRSGSAARIAISLSVLLGLLTAVLVFGGQTLERFNLRGAGTDISADYRWLIFKDTFDLIRASPWTGVGLGNFQPVFAIFRDESIGQSRALHPESDWLWLWAELGWPGVLLILIGAALLVRRVFPFVEGTNQWFRLAALIAALLFALHGIVDVAGHRVGSAYAGIFLFGLALKRPLPNLAGPRFLTFFRVLGFLLFVVGTAWVVAEYRGITLPGSVGADAERDLAASANVGRQFNQTIDHATRGLAWAPLDWQLYFLRALGKAGANRPRAEAVDDFRRARFLEQNSYQVPYQEGLAWITRDPVLAMTAWREALRRAGPQRPELFGQMLSSASQLSPAVNRMLAELGGVEPDLALTFLERARGEKFTAAIDRLIQHDPSLASLNPEQRARLFSLWSEHGDPARLAAFVEQRPEMLNLAWRGLAKYQASRKDFRGAVDLAIRFGTRPALPKAVSGSSIEELQRNILTDPNNYEAAYTLIQQQKQEGKMDDALITLRRVTGQSGSPAYFHFLEAEAWAAKEDWERAWTAWQAFAAAAR